MKAQKHLTVIFCSSLFLLFWSANSAYACMCKPNETVDKEFKNTPNVVVLTLQNVELLDKKSQGGANIWHSTFTVDKAFKGNLKTDDKLIFKNEYFGCGWSFSEELVGTKYLLYLGEKPGEENIWQVSRCSRSGSAKDTAEDLLFLENLEKAKDKTRLSGSVTQLVREMTSEGMLEKLTYLSGKNIHITGNGKDVTLKINENGVYEIYDLPPGKYKITLEKISGYSFTNENTDLVKVEIKAKSHTEEDIFYSIKNAIRGRLYDADGNPLKDIRLELIPANEDFPLFHIADTYTDENGNFEFERIPIGTFIIIINKYDEFSSDERFKTFYYPNTINRAEASEITITPGAVYKNFSIRVPQAAVIEKVKE